MDIPIKQIVNKHAGTCSCGSEVGPGRGFAQLMKRGEPWQVRCTPCVSGDTPTPQPAVAPLSQRPSFPLTDEQLAAVALFGEGRSIAIQAGAGTGKTSTLVAIAQSTTRIGQYVAFNKAIVQDAAAKLPQNCSAATAHSLAFRQVGKRYRHRLDSSRQSSDEMARRLKLDPYFWTFGEQRKVIQSGTLAGYVMKAITRFCNTADLEPTVQHMEYIDGVDLPDSQGGRTWVQNDLIRAHCARAIKAAWEDIVRLDGQLRFNPDHFLKIWELGIHDEPRIPGDFILFDEAQDASPVLLSVVEKQDKQVVFVGDAQQAIYEWRGAIDAMSTVPADATCYLTNSFRFGEGIADAANKILSQIPGAKLRLVGRGAESTVGPCAEPDCVLTRTNAGAIKVVLNEMEQGRAPHLVGGGGEVERFAKAAKRLIAGDSTDHPELCIFDSWADVQAYVASDPQGSELALMVKLIDDHGVDVILKAVGNTVSEQDADVVVSTAHKSKGREWDSVRVHSDFPEDRMEDGELRLMYVAVTRAKRHLDVETCAPILSIVAPERAHPKVEEKI